LQQADVLSVHLPAMPTTVGFLDGDRLAALKPGAIVVITSRGAVYDPAALAAALASGHIAAADTDVFPTEPPPPDDPLLGATARS
jgi:phosphoglycerate dehydrogenase-like enzyme